MPLRLDVYYQYVEPSNNKNGEAESAPQNVRRELLERWCIDYIASKPNQNAATRRNHASNTNTSNSTSMDDSAAQLRSVCKRIVVFLRTLYSLTRMMPGYKLHQALLQQQGNNNNKNNSKNVRPGLYGHVGTDYPGEGGHSSAGGYYQTSSDQNGQTHSANTGTNQFNFNEGDIAAVGGSIHFSFYVSNTEGVASEAMSLFSSTSNSPFSRQELNSVPTPFGLLHLTVLYDASINVERALQLRSKRLSLWREKHYGSKHTTHSISKAIPIHAQDGGQNPTITANASQPQAIHQQKPNSLPVSRIIHNYAVSPVSPNPNSFTNPQNNGLLMKQQKSKAKSYSPQVAMRTLRKMHSDSEHDDMIHSQNVMKNNDDMGGDPRERVGENSEPKRALSGLSLAFMSDENRSSGDDQHVGSPDGTHHGTTPTSPSSLSRNHSGGDSAWKQRLALHHPPPTIEISTNHLYRSSEYGYGYNNPVIANKRTDRAHCGSYKLSPVSPTSPGLQSSSTPPQPMFIGSGPRQPSRGTQAPYERRDSNGTDSQFESNNKSKDPIATGRISPPFRENPTKLRRSDIDIGNIMPTSQLHSGRNSPSIFSQTKQNHNLTTSPKSSENNILLPPITSLDVLTTSPFKTQFFDQNTSLLSSLSACGAPSAASAVYGNFDRSYAMPNGVHNSAYSSSMGWSTRAQGNASVFRSSNNYGAAGAMDSTFHKAIPDLVQTESFDEMPFAVDIGTPTPFGCDGESKSDMAFNSKQNGTGDSALASSAGSSQLVTSLAHRCATAGRLKLFDSRKPGNESTSENDASWCKGDSSGKSSYDTPNNNDGVDTVTSLADQLAEFRSFGASLTKNTQPSPIVAETSRSRASSFSHRSPPEKVMPVS